MSDETADIIGDVRKAVEWLRSPVERVPTLRDQAIIKLTEMHYEKSEDLRWCDAFPNLAIWRELAGLSVQFFLRMGVWPTVVRVTNIDGRIIHTLSTWQESK